MIHKLIISQKDCLALLHKCRGWYLNINIKLYYYEPCLLLYILNEFYVETRKTFKSNVTAFIYVFIQSYLVSYYIDDRPCKIDPMIQAHILYSLSLLWWYCMDVFVYLYINFHSIATIFCVHYRGCCCWVSSLVVNTHMGNILGINSLEWRFDSSYHLGLLTKYLYYCFNVGNNL